MEKVLLRARAFDTRINAGARSVSSQFVFGCVRGLMAVEAAITRLIETHKTSTFTREIVNTIKRSPLIKVGLAY